MEVISMTLVIRPQALERSTMSFIDNLRYENLELTKGASIPKQDAFDDSDPFLPDDMLDEYGDEIELEDDEDITFNEDKDAPHEESGPLIEPEPEENPKKKRGRKKKNDKNDSDDGQNDIGS